MRRSGPRQLGAQIGVHLPLSVCTASQTIVCGRHFGYAGMRQVLRERAGQKLRHGNGGADGMASTVRGGRSENRGRTFRRSKGYRLPQAVCRFRRERRTVWMWAGKEPPDRARLLPKTGEHNSVSWNGRSRSAGERSDRGGGDREKSCRSIIALIEQRGRDEEIPGPVRAAAGSEPWQSRTQSSFSNA